MSISPNGEISSPNGEMYKLFTKALFIIGCVP